MENPISEPVEMDRLQLPTTDIVDLSLEELERVAGALGDPGIIIHEK